MSAVLSKLGSILAKVGSKVAPVARKALPVVGKEAGSVLRSTVVKTGAKIGLGAGLAGIGISYALSPFQGWLVPRPHEVEEGNEQPRTTINPLIILGFALAIAVVVLIIVIIIKFKPKVGG